VSNHIFPYFHLNKKVNSKPSNQAISSLVLSMLLAPAPLSKMATAMALQSRAKLSKQNPAASPFRQPTAAIR